MNERLNNTNNATQRQFQVELNEEEEDEFVCPRFDFLEAIHNKLIYINHIFRQTPYVYEASCFSIGFVLFFFPLYYCIHYSYAQFTLLNVIEGNIRLSNNITFAFVCNYFVMAYIIGVFILKLMDVILTPNFMNWNLRTICSLLQYFILIICIQTFLNHLKSIFIEFDELMIDKVSNAMYLESNWGLMIKHCYYNLTSGIRVNKGYDGTMSIMYYLLYPFKAFSYYYLIIMALFYNNHSLSYVLICISFIFSINYSNVLFDNDYEEDNDMTILGLIKIEFKLITLVLSCYLFYILECIHKKIIESKKVNRKMLIVLNGIIACGIILILIACLKIIKYDLLALFDELSSIGNLLERGIIIVLTGNSYYAGSTLLNFIFYPIEKQYFVYRNPKYDNHIAVAKCVQFEDSPYNT